jgi:5-methylcytosine-specific restriction endonuclease McrA
MVGLDWQHFATNNPPKKLVLRAQGGACFYCQKPLGIRSATEDHLVPRSLGGTRTANKVIACVKCNQAKAARRPTESEVAKARDLYAQLGIPRHAVG